MADPLDELRKKLMREMEAANAKANAGRPNAGKGLLTIRQQRRMDFLRWLYNTPTMRQERTNVPPIGPSDHEWLQRALARLDDLDGAE